MFGIHCVNILQTSRNFASSDCLWLKMRLFVSLVLSLAARHRSEPIQALLSGNARASDVNKMLVAAR
jgi:hypothetical protein